MSSYAGTLWRQAAEDSERPDQASAAAFNLGVLLAEQGKPDKAAAAHRHAIDSEHPDHAPRAAGNLGVLLAEQGEPDKAAAAYQAAADDQRAIDWSQ